MGNVGVRSTEWILVGTIAAPKLLLFSYAMLNISREGHTHTLTDKTRTHTHTDKTRTHKQGTLTLSSPCDFI